MNERLQITEVAIKDNWHMQFLDRPITLTGREIESMECHLKEWVRHFPREGTHAETLGVPSLLVRFDYAFGQNPFEIEERPCGIGVTSYFSPQFKNLFGNQLSVWRKDLPGEVAIWVSSGRAIRRNHDDELWSDHFGVPIETGTPDHSKERYYWPRTNPTDLPHDSPLAKRLLAPVRHEGDKGYGKEMGWWKPVRPEPNSFSREPSPKEIAEYLSSMLPEGGALKSKGTRMESIVLWNPKLKNKASGITSHAQVLHFIRERTRRGDVVYAQPWSSPEVDDVMPGYYRFRRVYWAYDVKKSAYVCLGGCWMARPELRLHGASNAVTGLVVLP